MKSNDTSTQTFGKSLKTNDAANDSKYMEAKTASKTNSRKPGFRMKKDERGLRVIAEPSLAPETHTKPITDFRNGLAHELSVPEEELWKHLVDCHNHKAHNPTEQAYQLEVKILSDLVNLSGGEITYLAVEKLIGEIASDIDHTDAITKMRTA